MDYLLWNNVKVAFFKIHVSIVQTDFFLRERYEILFFCLFCIKNKVEEIWNFWRKRWTYPCRKILILRFFDKNLLFLSLKASFLSRTSTNTFSRFFLDKNEREKEVIFLTQSWTSPIEKISRLPFLKSMFLLSRQACFLTRTLRNTFFLFILHKKKVEEIWNFWRKRWTYPLWKILSLCFS